MTAKKTTTRTRQTARVKATDLTCTDCAVTACRVGTGLGNGTRFPDFCLSTSLDPSTLTEVLGRYDEQEAHRVMVAAAETEHEGYGRWPRVEETIQFARKIGAHKLGIATCVGLIQESRTLARILRDRGFEVFGVGCKVGTTAKHEVGIDAACEQTGVNMCNPILQAELLNEEGTDLNIVVGLCVGHDALFVRHSKAYATTLVAKDRVTGHNPIAALYLNGSYYRKLNDEWDRSAELTEPGDSRSAS